MSRRHERQEALGAGRRRTSSGRATLRVTTRNAQFQEWSALLTNRTKRQRAGMFVIHGVRPITLAMNHGWRLTTLLYPSGRQLSKWARDVVSGTDAQLAAVDPELMRELGEQASETPELLAIAQLPPDDLARIPPGPGMLVVVFDRPSSPGNIGTLIRSADALGASGLITTGHAADVYDPKCVRASTGSLFSMPAVRVASAHDVLAWVDALRADGVPARIIGTDEHGAVAVHDADLTGPAILVVGNEKSGVSAAWRDACDQAVRIPIGGSASSLNAASAGTVVLYEAARQRGFPVGRSSAAPDQS